MNADIIPINLDVRNYLVTSYIKYNKLLEKS